MRIMESTFYETRNNILAAMGVVTPNPLWDWESILGEMYNCEPEIEEEPVYIDTKTVYEVEAKKIWK